MGIQGSSFSAPKSTGSFTEPNGQGSFRDKGSRRASMPEGGSFKKTLVGQGSRRSSTSNVDDDYLARQKAGQKVINKSARMYKGEMLKKTQRRALVYLTTRSVPESETPPRESVLLVRHIKSAAFAAVYRQVMHIICFRPTT